MRPRTIDFSGPKPGSLRVLWRDFTDHQCCGLCQHALPSGVGFHLVEGRRIIVAGPECTQTFGRREKLPVPDLTEGLIWPVPDEGKISRRRSVLPEDAHETASLKRALAYVILIKDRLPKLGFEIEPFQPVDAAWHAYRQDHLTAQLLAPVRKRIETIGMGRPALTYGWLSQSYLAVSLIDRCVARGTLNEAAMTGLMQYRQQAVTQHRLGQEKTAMINRHVVQALGDQAPRLDPGGCARHYPLPRRLQRDMTCISAPGRAST